MRLEGWEDRLASIIDERRSRPFVWGEHDCTLFAANVALALTGVDYAAAYRGKYNCAFGSARVLQELGDGTLRGSVGLALGPEIPIRLAGRGDVVLWTQEELGDTLGVCIGAQSVFVGQDGLTDVPTLVCQCAWRIG